MNGRKNLCRGVVGWGDKLGRDLVTELGRFSLLPLYFIMNINSILREENQQILLQETQSNGL